MKFPDQIYYEPDVLLYPLGQQLHDKYADLPWIPIDNHNNIPELRAHSNADFPLLKRHLILGVRKTHRYVPNHKISDFLVPYTSSGCAASCLYCYLVCNYNKCSYLRLFVNREQMLQKLLITSRQSERPLCFEIGSNSDLILENTITGNLNWTIEQFAREGHGQITFPTKFRMVEPLLALEHRGKTLFRMSVNPQEIITQIEKGTSSLTHRITALNSMQQSGYHVGLLIAPVILLDHWKQHYSRLIDQLEQELSQGVKQKGLIEIIFMTYSYVQQAINTEAFRTSPQLLNKSAMTGRGRGKYCYRDSLKAEAQDFLLSELQQKLPSMKIVYIA